MQIVQKTFFASCYDLAEKRPIFVSTIDQGNTSARVIVSLVPPDDGQ
jgi:hypothetical protein